MPAEAGAVGGPDAGKRELLRLRFAAVQNGANHRAKKKDGVFFHKLKNLIESGLQPLGIVSCAFVPSFLRFFGQRN